MLVIGRDGAVEARKVTLGLEADDRIEVRTGLNEGDLVVVGSRAQLEPGAIVAPKVKAAADAGER